MLQVTNEKMFTFRFSSYRIFQYLLIVFVSREVIAGQTPKKCAAFNEYCQNHWDCCSNSCMSYLYRCSRGYNVYPYPFLGVNYKPTATLEQVLEQNFGRIHVGRANDIPLDRPKLSFGSRFGVPADDTTTASASVAEHTTIRSDTLLEDNLMAVLENRLGEEAKDTEEFPPKTEAVVTTISPKQPSCSEIGVKCYRNEECCTERCHGFLHQCVT